MINLSFAYVRISEIGPDPTPLPLDEEGNPIPVVREEDEFSEANLISDGLALVLELSKSLMHVDLSGMNLREKVFKIADAIKKNQHQVLVSLHLHDNSIPLTTKDVILKKLGIETSGYHKLKDVTNLSEQNQMEQAILEQTFSHKEAILSSNHAIVKGPKNLEGTSK